MHSGESVGHSCDYKPICRANDERHLSSADGGWVAGAWSTDRYLADGRRHVADVVAQLCGCRLDYCSVADRLRLVRVFKLRAPRRARSPGRYHPGLQLAAAAS